MNTYLKIIIPITVALVLTVIFFRFIEKGQAEYHVHKNERIKEIFEGSTAYDVLFLGSSRTHTSIIPSVVDSLSGKNSYNAGNEGGGILEFKMTLEGFLVNHPPPAVVFLNLDAHSLDTRKKIFFPLQYFDVIENDAVERTFGKIGDYKDIFIDKLSFMRIIYYDDYAKRLSWSGLRGSNELLDSRSFQDKGYFSNGELCADTATAITKSQEAVLDEDGIQHLHDIIRICREKNIHLIFTYAPEYDNRLKAQYNDFDRFMSTVTGIANDQKIPFYRDDNLSLCKDKCYFANYGHLNTPGAFRYSKVIGERVRDFFTTKTFKP